ncbi:calcium-binding protein [Pelodictyon phaeoclathratiforme]|jgi:hypothetical protein|uniref:Uncharacterized protein n=1 Tax=Pelodictyon phaeoclathratiforme (strain DSM 5477 / BU-1) TaxID=324925 RepID=B4SF24_PELPB|nr:calcium-binding protein [Pelodictyon phaeoclathratiforme]ACF43171.1 hypothetical protein Ppha_0883 [Pelodictyon phaeoclathratiforme BU-1]MBV5290611.1 hypothetical protein [Pelodictyon phaeoclathratiforme]
MKKAWASEGEALHKRHGREFAIPLAQIAVVDADKATREAVEDCHYWANRGCGFVIRFGEMFFDCLKLLVILLRVDALQGEYCWRVLAAAHMNGYYRGGYTFIKYGISAPSP